MRITFLISLALLLAGPAAALAEPYWIAWEGDALPEEQGWERPHGSWGGPGTGEAYRSLENGVLTFDSLHDAGVYDMAWLDLPGQMDPDPGEVFLMEWRLVVDQVIGEFDPGIGLCSDLSMVLGFYFSEDALLGAFEDELVIPISAGTFHDYRVVSTDMLEYDLYVDDEHVWHGAFEQSVGPAYVAWGDGVMGAASLHRWDYFRFGVVPEPGSFALLASSIICVGIRRAVRSV